MKDYMKQLTSMEMFEAAWNSDQVSVFVFSADWCPDCMFIKPFMPKLVEKYKHYEFIYVDRDAWLPICQRLNILGIPSFVSVKNGQELNRFVSKLRKSEAEIDAFLGGLQ